MSDCHPLDNVLQPGAMGSEVLKLIRCLRQDVEEQNSAPVLAQDVNFKILMSSNSQIGHIVGILPYLNIVPKILMGPGTWAQGPRWGYMVARRRGEHRVTSSATGAVLKAWPQATSLPLPPTLSIVSITYTNYTQGYCISISVSIKYSQHHSSLTVVSIFPSKI